LFFDGALTRNRLACPPLPVALSVRSAPARSDAIRRLVEIGLKVKSK
jgi:hypothetical protein